MSTLPDARAVSSQRSPAAKKRKERSESSIERVAAAAERKLRRWEEIPLSMEDLAASEQYLVEEFRSDAVGYGARSLVSLASGVYTCLALRGAPKAPCMLLQELEEDGVGGVLLSEEQAKQFIADALPAKFAWECPSQGPKLPSFTLVKGVSSKPKSAKTSGSSSTNDAPGFGPDSLVHGSSELLQ